MRNITIAPGEHYHIFNRGVNKQTIFFNDKDYFRFLFLILHLQSPITIKNIDRAMKDFMQHSVLHNVEEITEKRYVKLLSFCLMPNHFHLILEEIEEGGIAKYMQRILNSYTKYINTKYERSGHLFQGPYKAVYIEDERQLHHLSAYIHKNPMELKDWKRKESKYPWSSYQDLIGENRWMNLLSTDIQEGLGSKKDYEEFIKTSPAKELKEEFDYTEQYLLQT